MTECSLQLLFQSVQEHPDEVVGNVKGALPSWLEGSLVRNGPAKWDLQPDFCLNHFFDGCALLTKFNFTADGSDGLKKVTARTRYLRSDAYQKMEQVGRPVFTEFGTKAYPDTTKSMWSRLVNKLVPSDLTDNDFANVYQVHGELYASTESCNIWKLDPNDLRALHKINLDKHPGISICSAHPLYSPEEGVSYNVGSTFLTGMKYHVMKTVEKGVLPQPTNPHSTVLKNSSTLCTLSSSYKGNLAYSHSFSMSSNFLVLIEQPFLVNALRLVTCTPKGKSMWECIEWCPDEPTRFHVIRKSDGSVVSTKFVADALFFLHTINAFEQEDELVLDMITYTDPTLFDSYRIEKLRNEPYKSIVPPVPMRFVLPLADVKTLKKGENLVKLVDSDCTAKLEGSDTIRLQGQQLGPAGMENPTMNPQLIGKPYQYVYGAGLFEQGFYSNSVGKMDVRSLQVQLYKRSPKDYPGEPVFVPRPDGDSEDDGVLISQVLTTDETRNNYLAVLDAKTLQELAIIEFDRKLIQLPPSIHGVWQWPATISDYPQKSEL